MSTPPRQTTRSFTAKRNSESGYQSSAWDSGRPAQYTPTIASIHHHHQQQQQRQQQRRQQQSPWPEPRLPRRPILQSSPFGVYTTLPFTLSVIILLISAVGEYFKLWPNSITPAPADFGWIEYIPHARVSRFRGAQHEGDGGGDDIAFALGSAQHAAFATAAWRVFSAIDANANWTDPRKAQPTPGESLACRARVDAEYARLAEIWNPERANYINSTDPHDTRLLPYRNPLLGGLSGAQLRGVESVLRVAYRDALFLCMTLTGKRRWLTILETSEMPNSAWFFPVDVEESGAAGEEKENTGPGDNQKVAGEGGDVDGENVPVNGEDEKADRDNATLQGWGRGEKEL